MLFKRYGGAVQEVLSLDFEDFIEQINFVIDEKAEEDVRQRWLNGYQNMSLDEFKQAMHYRKPSECMIEQKPIENVLEDLLFKFR
ncbi:hypothetical protein QTL86_13530 [Cellulosilyticum sp. ST5]|uniref:hypothetical protein n=1 Tax=Cellulosilyticum sp. ST5 TaxID=3055805 RepID=UPI003977666C